ncbi:GDP-fucose transporter 1-like [Engystomops pustulosus]|uniref:GDP-fucose transporter 1-like n=1 Tax=Engystomops pustulosus TaxID=76066 RepID=UPI003AFA4327
MEKLQNLLVGDVDYFGFSRMVLFLFGDPEKDSLQKRTVNVILVVISIIIIVLNKSLLDSSSLMLGAPFFITFYQCLLTISLLHFIFSEYDMEPPFLRFTPKILQNISPPIMVFIGFITFNQRCLHYIGLDISPLCWCLNTISNLLLSYILVTQTETLHALLSCGVILGGFWLGITPGTMYSLVFWGAIVFFVLTCICLALTFIYIKMFSKGLKSVDLQSGGDLIAYFIFMMLVVPIVIGSWIVFPIIGRDCSISALCVLTSYMLV